MKYLENLKNNIDFFLRQHLVFSRKNYSEENESKEGLLTESKALEREKFLVEKHIFDSLAITEFFSQSPRPLREREIFQCEERTLEKSGEG